MSRITMYCCVCQEVTLWHDYGTADECIECAECGCKTSRPEEPVDPEYVTKLEDALCMAICIIRNEAGTRSLNFQTETESTLNRWADELIEESGIDFDAVLARTKEPEDVEPTQPLGPLEG